MPRSADGLTRGFPQAGCTPSCYSLQHSNQYFHSTSAFDLYLCSDRHSVVCDVSPLKVKFYLEPQELVFLDAWLVITAKIFICLMIPRVFIH